MKPDTRIASCPACEADALLTGTKIKSSEPILEDNRLRWEDVYLPTEFRCACCGLALMGPSLLQAANLGGQFALRREADPSTFFSPAEEYFEEYDNM